MFVIVQPSHFSNPVMSKETFDVFDKRLKILFVPLIDIRKGVTILRRNQGVLWRNRKYHSLLNHMVCNKHVFV